MAKRKTAHKPKARASWPAPSAAVCTAATRALASLHGLPKRPSVQTDEDVGRNCGATPSVLEAVVRTILSQNTTNKNSTAAMKSLLKRFDGDWEAMRTATPEAIGQSIAIGGLGQVKGRRIHALLQQLHREHGAVSLEHIREMSDDEASQILVGYDGIGPKTASCVLLFCLGRDSFAVDTHVLRICKRLGWISPNATREQAFVALDAAVPAAQKYALHVLMVTHGKCCPECAANGRPQRPPLGACPLAELVPGATKANKRPRAPATTKRRCA